MQSIIHSQQDEIIKQLEASSDLKNDLKASEKRVDLLKDTIEDFANALYSCRDETRELDRQRRKLEAENQELRDETPSKPLAQSIATFTLQQQAATYEREMRALVSQISAARDDVAQQYSEIAALNKTLAAVSIHSSELARRNEFLSQDNTDLHQRISELDCSKDMTLNSATSQSNGTEFAAGGGSTREEQPVVRGFTHISTGRLVSDGHR